jgi:hypothetical protein
MNKKVAIGIIAAALCSVILFSVRRASAPAVQTNVTQIATAAVPPAPTTAAVLTVEEPLPTLEEKIKQLKMQAWTDFNKLTSRLEPYGNVDNGRNREVFVQRRTNQAGGINIEVEVRSTTHKATFGAGPISLEGKHTNPFLPDGALLNLFASLELGSDTRRNQDAVNSWYQSTGVWSEQEAVAETFRLMEQMGMPTNQVVTHRFKATPITVKNPAGESVRVTPFYMVQMSKDANDDDSSFLNVEFRIDDKPPGKVTRWFSWPPVKVP